jgi:hypothetical protein
MSDATIEVAELVKRFGPAVALLAGGIVLRLRDA